MINYDDPSTDQFCLGGLILQLSVLEFSATLGLYTEEFKEENELHALTHHIHFSPSKCWHTLAPSAASYSLSLSKHEDPPSQPPPPSRPVHAAASYADISERLTQFEQQWKNNTRGTIEPRPI
ncbi:hypothetical protein GOBAR_AA10731 [Gossypium barbadense]|uniref:Uncharacterized protein n=1 Tax=Gossypium barbadense TaxID=3634 RepID=A0A2P5Y2T3_GOSBA|nr:hypothetical protein GOBAR_AA10731 [Gossypium barbadense]